MAVTVRTWEGAKRESCSSDLCSLAHGCASHRCVSLHCVGSDAPQPPTEFHAAAFPPLFPVNFCRICLTAQTLQLCLEGTPHPEGQRWGPWDRWAAAAQRSLRAIAAGRCGTALLRHGAEQGVQLCCGLVPLQRAGLSSAGQFGTRCCCAASASRCCCGFPARSSSISVVFCCWGTRARKENNLSSAKYK